MKREQRLLVADVARRYVCSMSVSADAVKSTLKRRLTVQVHINSVSTKEISEVLFLIFACLADEDLFIYAFIYCIFLCCVLHDFIHRLLLYFLRLIMYLFTYQCSND